ncbi:hypothetical protein O1611_g2668 [Lasiodiplodia mahajangana]|uniref:Uncharacterized protein n=1 Tax=Lasiodiplodia mahajangana TaxID=1108764 RepID=A0ACC2JU88_9PEZI|nr:hypothetical protein O1611_g2668 [Lasiodiplodia mahajangana]
MSTAQFALSPEQESTVTQFFYRQIFITPPPLNSHEVNVSGKTAIVTGSNSGIGFECASQLLDLGVGKLILAVRRVESGEEAKVKLVSQRGESANEIEVWKLDMSDYDSIMAFTKRADALARLDIVILNAGVRKVLLLPIIKAKRQNSEPGRITLVSSDSARMALLEERNESPFLPAFKRSHAVFNGGEQYNKSKVLVQLMMSQLAKHVPNSIANINMATPGFCRRTGIMRELYSPMVAFVADNVTRLFGRSAAVGARVVVNAAVKQGSESHGQCIGDCMIKPMARLIYTEEGEALSQALWEELMSEFSFAGIREIMLDLED